MKKSEIYFSIALDDQHVPEAISWRATDAGDNIQFAKAINVSIWDRDQATLDGIAARGDERIQTLNVDIGDLPNVEDATQRVLGHFGKIDILLNNAALVGPNRTTWEYDPQDFMDVVHIGLVGTFFCCRTIVPHMIGQNYGRIVSTASIAG